MNELEAQGDKVQWGDSEADLPSDCYSSDSDESDAEVPDVTDPFATTSNGGAPSSASFFFSFIFYFYCSH